MEQNNPDSVIRITKDEAASTHVDDMLKRQMSLRGEPGVTRDRGRKWYYQNWLVFMLVGTLGAIAAWAILEPYFDDYFYIQGEITSIDLLDKTPSPVKHDEDESQLKRVTLGTIVVKGQTIMLDEDIKQMRSTGRWLPLDPETLHVGQTVGAYVKYYHGRQQDFAMAAYLQPDPPPITTKKAGLTLEEQYNRNRLAGLLFFSIVAGMIGLFIGAIDGFICRLPSRALLSGVVGLLVGLVGGFITNMLAEVIYSPITAFAEKQAAHATSWSTFSFVIQMMGRSLAWAMAGVAMGIGQGIALRSKRLLLYGLLGGIVGGLLGGLLFDPIDMLLLGGDKVSAHWSRLIGLAVVGASVGAMIGVVELLARDAWLRMTQGPLTGKEFLIFKDVMNIGSSPRSDIYLFNDPQVAEQHAVIRTIGDECEIEPRSTTHAVLLNNRTVTRSRLRHGDNVTIGRTMFVFQRRKG